MQHNTLAQTALALLVSGGIIGGLLTVGGPGQGRKERRDSTRFEDIQRLGNYITCLARHNDKTLPEEMTSRASCPGHDRLSDPFTDAPYVYEKLSDVSYRICATFEAPDSIEYYNSGNFDRATGCYTHIYRP